MFEFIGGFIKMNIQLTYFPYGLFFFASGIGILVQHRKKYPFRFAKDLWIMGFYALIHATSEWPYVFIAIQGGNLSPQSLFSFYTVQLLLETISFMILFVFGLRLLNPGRLLRIIFIPTGVFLLWCVIIGLLIIQKVPPTETLLYAKQFSHYLLIFPSSLVTAVALYRQGKELEKAKITPKILSSVKSLAVIFLLSALFSGMVVTPGSFFPSNLINTREFSDLIPIPYQLFRGLIGAATMIVTLKLLHEFNSETDRILAQTEKDAMRFSERERIGQDLHDGVIQTLYATGLMLEATVQHLDSESPIREQLNFCMKSLNTSLLDLRYYITGLRNEENTRKELKILLENLLSEIQVGYIIQVEHIYKGNEHLQLTPNRQNHIYYVLKELLSNIGKHTNANKIILKLIEGSNKIMISLWDNGRGKEESPEKFWIEQERPTDFGFGMGLRNIKERITILRGEIQYSSPPDGGTLVTICIPKEVSLKK